VCAEYHVVVPDMLGYGRTDKPLAAEEYSTKNLCADLAALLDIIGVSSCQEL
jgi:soluble epoxide hydrolase/lipid-phosphate phosphatase